MTVRLLPLVLLFACSGDSSTPAEAPEGAEVEAPAEAAKTGEDEHFTAGVGEVSVISRKNGEVEDTHHIKVSGVDLTIPAGGDFLAATGSVDVDVTTWNSGLEIRDQRVKELFFDAASHPTATFELTKVSGFQGKMVSTDVEDAMLEGKLSFAGTEGPAVFPVQVSRPTDDSWVISTPNPVLIDTEEYGLDGNVGKVAEACGVELATEFKMSFTLLLGEVPEDAKPAMATEAAADEAPAEAGDAAAPASKGDGKVEGRKLTRDGSGSEREGLKRTDRKADDKKVRGKDDAGEGLTRE